MTENEEPLVVRLDHLVLTVRDPQATVRFYEPEFPIYLYIAGFRRQFSSPSRSKTSLWRPKISPSQTFPVDEL